MIPTQGKALIKFSANWCAPCKAVSKILEELNLYTQVVHVDIDQYPDLAHQYSIRGIPTLVVIQDGVETNRLVGMTTATKIKQLVE